MQLPRSAVADHLEQINPSICARYLVFLIEERAEVSPLFHDRLAELYLSMTLSAKKRGDDSASLVPRNFDHTHSTYLCAESWKNSYSRLLQFINLTHYYTVDRLYGLLSSEGCSILSVSMLFSWVIPPRSL